MLIWYMDKFLLFRKCWPNSWQYSKAKGHTKANLWISMQVKFNFWQITHIFLLFKLWKQLKIHSPFVKINSRKNFEQLSFLKITPRENFSALGKRNASASSPWLIRACQYFHRFRNKIEEVIIWVCCTKYVYSSLYPNGVVYWQKHFGTKWKINLIKGKNKLIRYFAYCYCRYRIIKANED